MRDPQPPDNLPVVPAGQQQPWERPVERPASSFRWGAYEATPASLAKFRELLTADLGEVPWNDNELEVMLRDLVHAYAVLFKGPSDVGGPDARE